MASMLYIPEAKDLERDFRALLESVCPHEACEVCRSYEELVAKLRRPFSNVKVAVLFAANREEIARLVSLRDLLTDVKMILVLENEDRETMMSVHTLRPRYVTWMDCGLRDVAVVYQRMVGLYDSASG